MGGPAGKYLGIQRWRFYIKCTHCSRAITFCTDPQNADYEMESGGTRNYEVYKDKEQQEDEAEKEKEEEEKADHMKALENRVLDSQREMADLDNLEEIKAMNRRHIHLLSAPGEAFSAGANALLDKIEAKKTGGKKANTEQSTELTEQDEALIKSIQFGQSRDSQLIIGKKGIAKKKNIKRLDEDDEKRLEAQRQKEIENLEKRQQEIANKAKAKKTAFPIIKSRRKRPTEAQPMDPPKKAKIEANGPPAASSGGGGLATLLGGYGSSDSD